MHTAAPLANADRVLHSLADGIYVTDSERRILFWNEAAERITGWRPGDIVGRSCFDDVLVHQDQDGHKLCGQDSCPLYQAMRHDEPSRLPQIIFAQARDGRRIPVEVSVAPVHDAAGRVIGGVEAFRDLSLLLEDLERARHIQSQAMRSDLAADPRLAVAVHSVPQAYVSGDFHRVERLDADHYAFLLADVMGHGVASALYTIYMRSVWEEARRLLPDPAVFVRHLNDELGVLTRHSCYFATALYAVLDLRDRACRYVVAGHPPPFLLRAGQVAQLPGRGPAIGMFPDAEYVVETVPLRPGDALLACSDGALEVADAEGVPLGADGLARLLLAGAGAVTGPALAALCDRLLAHGARQAFEDDLTLLGVALAAEPP